MYFEEFTLFGKDEEEIKRNCLPIDPYAKKMDKGLRLVMLNTHIVNTLAAMKTMAIMSGLIGLVFGGLGSALFGLKISALIGSYPLLRQYDARDFFFMPEDIGIDSSKEEVLQAGYAGAQYPIRAINDGKVIYTFDNCPNNNNWGEYLNGNFVVISHYNNKFFSTYCHLYHGSVKVKKGQKVEKGQIVGTMGNTGNSTWPHLHFETTYVDPRNPLTIGKILDNFEDYMRIPFEILKCEDTKYWKKITKKPLEKNDTGRLDQACILN